MTPEQTIRNKQYLQMLLTLVLAVILMGIIGLYIYFGMRQAGNTIVMDTTATTTPTVQSDSTEASKARRMQVLENLVKESTFTMSLENRAKVLKNLSATSVVSSTSAEKRLKVLNALANNPV